MYSLYTMKIATGSVSDRVVMAINSDQMMLMKGCRLTEMDYRLTISFALRLLLIGVEWMQAENRCQLIGQ